MNKYAFLASSKQAFDELIALCPPEEVSAWKPSLEQRSRYIWLGGIALDGLERIESMEKRRLFSDSELHSVVPESLLGFIRNDMEPRRAALRASLDLLDPEGAVVRDVLSELSRPGGTKGRVRSTFEEGLNQLYELLDRNPEWGHDHPFMPDTAFDVLDSKLIQFEPDEWMDRVGDLSPVRTSKNSFQLPVQVRFRLEELFRAYVVGLWLSVLGLARAILEYAVLDNLFKFGVDASWPPDREGRRKPKRLSDLIEEVSQHIPAQALRMSLIVDHGNKYLHPTSSGVSKTFLFDRKSKAEIVVAALVDVVEALYLAPAGPRTGFDSKIG